MSTYQDIAVPIGVGVGIWFTAAPSIQEMIDREPAGDNSDLRHLEVLTAVLTLGTGAAGAVVCGDSGPLLASLLVLVTLFVAYEVALNMESRTA